jgi:hypothetical protein|uniref:thiol oxidase n=1 Tax=viral metagenome TaxID=1070528 RepID=A0A6C0J4A4_9ZZZZ
MQTTKWGPSGWNLFHNVALKYDPQNSALYKQFYESFKYLLPCKYCRESYTLFLKEKPIQKFLVSSERLFYWTYLMHNKVNDKLRKQGFLKTENPSYATIKKFYDIGCYNKCTYIDYVTFIGCVVFNYGSIGSTKDCPSQCTQTAYKIFFKHLNMIFPKEHPITPETKILDNNCNLVVWYYTTILNREKINNQQLFDKYINYFVNMRATCSTKTSCRVKL